MDKNFWIGIIVGILIVVAGLVFFGDKISAPSPSDVEERLQNNDDEQATTTEESEGATIWNEFDGEIGI